MLAGPDPLVILYMPCDSTQDDLLHQLPRHRGRPAPAVPVTRLASSGLQRGHLDKKCLRSLALNQDTVDRLLFSKSRAWAQQTGSGSDNPLGRVLSDWQVTGGVHVTSEVPVPLKGIHKRQGVLLLRLRSDATSAAASVSSPSTARFWGRHTLGDTGCSGAWETAAVLSSVAPEGQSHRSTTNILPPARLRIQIAGMLPNTSKKARQRGVKPPTLAAAVSLISVGFCLIAVLESLKQLLTCAESWDKAGRRARERPKEFAAAGEAEGGTCDEGDMQQRLPDLQLVLAASCGEAGRAGVSCSAWKGESAFNSPSTLLLRTDETPESRQTQQGSALSCMCSRVECDSGCAATGPGARHAARCVHRQKCCSRSYSHLFAAVGLTTVSVELCQQEGCWKRPLGSSSPTINPTPPCLLNHVPKCHIYMFFELLQGW
ncbi:hypothetical protein QYF61_018788 [Mycteria americana]|uniref:Uncharacterized protein n=1 Tax=Mycteria americana TaxID=33587 RepID=A0AAN7NGY2_MYCAM|nr:hypothetical protein QYF61_018788 [Mycteria americana]